MCDRVGRIACVECEHVERGRLEVGDVLEQVAGADVDGVFDAAQCHVLAGDVGEVGIAFVGHDVGTGAGHRRREDARSGAGIEDAVALRDSCLADNQSDIAGTIGAPVRSK